MAALSLLTALLVWRLAVDPRHLENHPSVHGGAGATGAADVEAAASGGGVVLQAGRAAGVDWRRAWRDAKAVLAIRSFQILVLQGAPIGRSAGLRRACQQCRPAHDAACSPKLPLGSHACAGIVGSMPWVSLTWLTTWLQLLGFSDLNAASLMATFGFGCALGGLLGGWVGGAVRGWRGMQAAGAQHRPRQRASVIDRSALRCASGRSP